MKSLTCLCLFLLLSFLHFNSICWAQEEEAVDFDFLYGRITAGFNLDGWGVFSDSEPIWEGKAGWGKKGLFNIELRDRYKEFYNKTFELPTISASLSLKNNWRISLYGLDYTRIKYRDEGSIRETSHGEYKISKHRSTSYDFTLTTIYLTKDGKIHIPKRLLNFSYYHGVFLNRGQVGFTGDYYQKGWKNESVSLTTYDSGARVWRNVDSPFRESCVSLSAVYGISDSWNLTVSGNYEYRHAKTLSSIYAPDSALADTIHYYPSTYFSKSSNKRKIGVSSIELKVLINSRFAGMMRYDFEYTKAIYRGAIVYQNQPKKTSEDSYEVFTHFFWTELIYLSPNPCFSQKRILDDYADYYGHLLTKRQVKWKANLFFEGEDRINTLRNRKLSFITLNLKLKSEFAYGLTERVNLFSSVHLDKITSGYNYASSHINHYAHLYYNFGFVLYTYSYDKHYREDISWEKVSDFDYIFGPLLSKGQSQFEIVISPRGYSGSWVSLSSNPFQLKKLKYLKYGRWLIKPKAKLGITDFIQFSFIPAFEIDSSREIIQYTTTLDFQLWSDGRLTLSYFHQSETYMGYLYSLYGLTSSAYNITIGLNFLI